MSKKKWLGILIAGVILLTITGFFLIVRPDMGAFWHIFSSMENFRAFIQQFGFWAPIIFFVIQTLQVIISPIPGNLTTLAGGAMFGVLPGFLLSATSMLLGSLIAFYLARVYGQKIVVKLIGQKQFDKYASFASGKYSLSLLILFLVPFFPDDALCLIAGLSSLPLGVFTLFLIIGRLPSVLLTTLVGAGILSFDLWEWVIIGVLSLIIIVFFWRYGDKFEGWMRKRLLQKKP